MTTARELSRRLRHCVLPLLWVAAIAYIGYHTVQGDRGLAAWLQSSQRIDRLEADLHVARAERRRLEHKVALLRSDGLDRDMLDERARGVLSLARPDELVFLRP